MLINGDRVAGLFHLMIGASMISFSGVFVKLAQVGPTTAGFYRVLFGGIILLLLVLAKGDGKWKRGASWGHAMLCGLFFALDLTFWHRSVHALGPGVATLLANFQVFFLAGFGVMFLGERVSRTLLFSVPLSLFGLFLIVGLNWRELELAQGG
ncbi:MAG: EamA family transporter [Thermodesulfobacteriota bacterium]